MDKGIVKELLDSALEENKDLFLIELKFLADNKIYIEVDGDKGVSLKECMRISRAIDNNFDREEEDFSLEVTSPDVAHPLKVKRQYIKNLKRTLDVKLRDNSNVQGELKNVTEDTIELEWKAREPKPIGKGKITVIKNQLIQFDDILEAKVKIIF